MKPPLDIPDYEDASDIDWVMYELSTLEYDYQIHPEAIKQIEIMFKRYVK